MYTYSELVHKYADDVRAGRADTDLGKRERAVLAVMLHTAGNMHPSRVQYPPTEDDRKRTLVAWGDALWDGNVPAFLDACAPRLDHSALRERAITILRNI